MQLGRKTKGGSLDETSQSSDVSAGQGHFPRRTTTPAPLPCAYNLLYICKKTKKISISVPIPKHTHIFTRFSLSFRLRMCIPVHVLVLTCVNQRMCVLPTFTRVKDDLSFVLPVTLSRIFFRSFSKVPARPSPTAAFRSAP